MSDDEVTNMTAPVQPGWYPDRSDVHGITVATLQPKDDPFYSHTGPQSLDSIAPGTVLQTRSFRYHIFGFPTLLETTQLLYRSTSQTGKATVNVTSVIQPPIQLDKTKGACQPRRTVRRSRKATRSRQSRRRSLVSASTFA
jgi:hypothetical protein